MKIIVSVRKKFREFLMTYSKVDNIILPDITLCFQINFIPEQNNLGN